ncbi:zinc-ribbon domain-containing protein, partial [Sandarakinorhabdus rubra]|uniref:zinc-ribbon domain-containing protein n=1 Tax=Sandarakinorhabdus rubra TaxID=2672568 RepID=UPI001969F780
MIITCPNCDARYQVPVGVLMRRPKLKCAECGHRWVPADEIDEDEAVAAVQEEARVARLPPAPEPEPDPQPEPEPEPAEAPPRAPVLKWLLAVALGA